MEISKYIVKFENILPKETIQGFQKYCLDLEFDKAKIFTRDGGQTVNEKIRKTLKKDLHNLNCKSLSDVHWTNLLLNIFNKSIKEYKKIHNLNEYNFNVIDMQLLKYIKGGHYKFHVDDSRGAQRLVSCIFLINENYEGGDLLFKDYSSNEIIEVKKKENMLLVWPSNFLFPHSVKPVTEGERYSVVAWAK